MKLSKRDESKPRRDDIDEFLMVPLARQAVEILRTLRAFTEDDVYVFPGARDRNRRMSENAILTAMRRMGISKEEMCGHDFRATTRTILRQELKIREDLIEHELGHQVIDPNDRAYNSATFLAERRLMAGSKPEKLRYQRLRKAGQVTVMRATSMDPMQALRTE